MVDFRVKTKEEVKAEMERRNRIRKAKEKARRIKKIKAIAWEVICSVFMGIVTVLLFGVGIFSLIAGAFMCI